MQDKRSAVSLSFFSFLFIVISVFNFFPVLSSCEHLGFERWRPHFQWTTANRPHTWRETKLWRRPIGSRFLDDKETQWGGSYCLVAYLALQETERMLIWNPPAGYTTLPIKGRWGSAPSKRCSFIYYRLNYDFTCTALQNPSLPSIVKRVKTCGDWVCGFRGMLSCPENMWAGFSEVTNDIICLRFIRVHLSDLQGGGMCQ